MEEVDRIFNSMGINLKHITKKEMTFTSIPEINKTWKILEDIIL